MSEIHPPGQQCVINKLGSLLFLNSQAIVQGFGSQGEEELGISAFLQRGDSGVLCSGYAPSRKILLAWGHDTA